MCCSAGEWMHRDTVLYEITGKENVIALPQRIHCHRDTATAIATAAGSEPLTRRLRGVRRGAGGSP